MIPRPSFFPQHIISLEGSDESLMSRAKGTMPEEEDEEQKAIYTLKEERITRRLPIHRKLHTDSNTSIHYLDSQSIENLKIDVSEASPEELVNQVKEYLTRLESPVTLINETDEFLRWRNTKAALLSFKDEEARKTKVFENLQAEEEMQKTLAEEEAQEKLAAIIEAEKELLDVRSQSLRQYLVDNLIPHLMKGLIEVCKVMPDDPIEMLIDLLEKTADELIDSGEG